MMFCILACTGTAIYNARCLDAHFQAQPLALLQVYQINETKRGSAVG